VVVGAGRASCEAGSYSHWSTESQLRLTLGRTPAARTQAPQDSQSS